MPKIQQDLIDPSSLADSAGVINYACLFDDHGAQRFILIGSKVFYTYDLDDPLSERFVWMQIVLSKYAKMSEIAAATGIGLRSLERWHQLVSRGGFGALVPKPITGRPPVISDSLASEVLRVIALGHGHKQIMSLLKLSGSSIDRIVAAHKAESLAVVQDQLGLDEVEVNVERLEPASQVSEQVSAQERRGVQSADDPLNRSLDRMFARVGLIDDADPLFAPGERLTDMGFFMIVALLD